MSAAIWVLLYDWSFLKKNVLVWETHLISYTITFNFKLNIVNLPNVTCNSLHVEHVLLLWILVDETINCTWIGKRMFTVIYLGLSYTCVDILSAITGRTSIRWERLPYTRCKSTFQIQWNSIKTVPPTYSYKVVRSLPVTWI